MADWIIEPFSKGHTRDTFTCGQPSLDDFIQNRVSQYEKRRLGKTYIAVRTGEPLVIGYYTLAAGTVSFEHLPVAVSKKLHRHPTPAILLARLAVDRTAQGKRLGEALLLDAMQRSLNLSDAMGIHVLSVETINDSALTFYRKYGFISLQDDIRHLYLPISTVETLLG